MKQNCLSVRLSKLNELIERNSKAAWDPIHPYPRCVKFAFCRSFSFAKIASQQEPATAIFIVPSLRAITEDLILFRFLLQTCTPDEQNMIIKNMMLIDVWEKTKYQTKFFNKFRPFQPVLSYPVDLEQQVIDAKEELANHWRKHGWSNFRANANLPPIREMAERSDSGILEVVYDFIYRLASGEVHSTPRSLLRLSWGEYSSSSEEMKSIFSTENLSLYYLEVAQVYSTYLFCLWFELFDNQFDASTDEIAAVSSLREYLLSITRWPEMVTFEEMNVAPPKLKVEQCSNIIIQSLFRSVSREGFVSGMETILQTSKSNRQDKEH